MVCLARLVLLALLISTTHCLECSTDHFFANATHCQECSRCEYGEQYGVRACNGTHDTVCGNCTACVEDEYEAAECKDTHDTVCKPCSACAPGLTFALNACGPDSDADTVCQNCSRCEAGAVEARPCSLTQDAVCVAAMTTVDTAPSEEFVTTSPKAFVTTSSKAFVTTTSSEAFTTTSSQTFITAFSSSSSTPTILSLTLTTDLPALTPAMLKPLGDALAAELGLPNSAVQALDTPRRRKLLATDMVVRFRVLAALPPERVRSMNLAAVAKASGLPIVIRSAVASPEHTPHSASSNAPAIIGGLAALVLCAAMATYSVRRSARVRDDAFTNLEPITVTMVHEPIQMPRLVRPSGM